MEILVTGIVLLLTVGTDTVNIYIVQVYGRNILGFFFLKSDHKNSN